jgi:steroid 5-alpha reductase family enzyme
MTLSTAGALGLILIVAAASVVWLISVRMRDASIADIGWGPGFVSLAWAYVAMFDAFQVRPLTIAALITLWGVRLAWHIASRHDGEDRRYAAMRDAHGSRFWWRSLFTVFWLQAVILWFVALPVLAAAGQAGPARATFTDAAGLILFAIGFLFEAVGDYQLMQFRRDPANRGRVLDSGLWRYTRHPNYFGDAVLWWGLFLIAASVPGGWLTIASPALMTFLLVRVSGVTLLERNLRTSRPGYDAYVQRTSPFFPWPPGQVRDRSA